MFVPIELSCSLPWSLCLSVSHKVPNVWLTKQKGKLPCQFSVGKQGLKGGPKKMSPMFKCYFLTLYVDL